MLCRDIAKLTPLQLQLNTKLTFISFKSRAHSQCDALAALALSPPRLTQRCGDGLNASRPTVGTVRRPGDSAIRGSVDAGCEAD